MLSLRGEAEAAGAAFAFHTPLLRAKAAAGKIEIDAGGDAPMTLECNLLINAAGLGAPSVARSIEGMPIELIPSAYLAKGNYFSCSARAPFSRLIYPVPEPGGLGVHLTLDMIGLLTPPFGLLLFVVAGMRRRALPFVLSRNRTWPGKMR